MTGGVDRGWRRAAILPLLALACGCSTRHSEGPGAEVSTVHLEELLATAEVVGAEPPTELTEPLVWRFEDGALGWRPLPTLVPDGRPARLGESDAGLVVTLEEATLSPEPNEWSSLHGGIFVEVPDWEADTWSHVLIEARTSDPVSYLDVGYSVRREAGEEADERWPLLSFAAGTIVVSDGEWQTYRLDAAPSEGQSEVPIRELGIEIGAFEPVSFEIRSITWIPQDALFADAGHGVRSIDRRGATEEVAFGPLRRALFAHTPARISYRLTVPSGGRLDLGLGSQAAATRFSVEVGTRAESQILLDETVPADEPWEQRSVDLSTWGGNEITLTLGAEPSDARSIAQWAAPTVSGSEPAERPNVILYVIDGASAGQMSLYGYERETTPRLDALASEGVVFERAHSNSTWTTPSTASFMTSLHHSVLGGYRGDLNPVPADAVTMAEHFHRAGYQTAVFTTNPNAGSLSNLQRGVDAFRDRYAHGDRPSSVVLFEEFARWREAYPGEPYWVHFQSTDVHPPYHPPEPFAGRFADTERREAFAEWMERVDFPWNHDSASVHEHYREELESEKIPARAFYATMRDIHDEAMAHQDEQLGRLVEHLRTAGEWERTILVLASDHGHPAASYPRFGRGLLDPQPPAWAGALMGEFLSHIPLVVFWPEEIEGGRRIERPVSMIDLLPTLLDLAGLPPAEVSQGRSLVPALRGERHWQPGPMVFDEFRVMPRSGGLLGNLEILDGSWGASLEISEGSGESGPVRGRHPAPAGGRWPSKAFPDVSPLLLFDLAVDPLAHTPVDDAHPDRLRRAARDLRELWKAHRALALHFSEGESEESALTPEQLESLRSLGYIQ